MFPAIGGKGTHRTLSPHDVSQNRTLRRPQNRELRDALRDRIPFLSGTCTVPDYQRLVYYSHGDTFRRVDFSNAGAEELATLYQACKPAEFGRNGENVLDDSYRKAGKMELSSFSTQFDPRSLGIYDQVTNALLSEKNGFTMEMELYKLNVYGPGDFFKAHQDTPRSKEMFGSLVVVLPTMHEGGPLVLRQEDKEWTIDFTDQFAATTEPSVGFAAFFGDIEHEVLPVTSGYRVTLTYNLFHKPSHITSASHIQTSFHQKLKQELVEILHDPSTLPNGGYLGFGLFHQYVYTGSEPVASLIDQLKGADRALANVCDELGLRYCLKLLYRGFDLFRDEAINLISDHELLAKHYYELESGAYGFLEMSLEEATIDQVEGVELVGSQYKFNPQVLGPEGRFPFLRPFYREPVTEVLEITKMKSSVGIKTPFMAYGNEAQLEYFYGTACMFVAIDKAEVRVLPSA